MSRSDPATEVKVLRVEQHYQPSKLNCRHPECCVLWDLPVSPRFPSPHRTATEPRLLGLETASCPGHCCFARCRPCPTGLSGSSRFRRKSSKTSHLQNPIHCSHGQQHGVLQLTAARFKTSTLIIVNITTKVMYCFYCY